ncbi:MAG: alpha/beta fold hydrolase [Chloroflexi bacterium]|nr:alpha/beta fold hydrolase [Chloroflexota bacterium]
MLEETVSFQTSDGLRLSGTLFRPVGNGEQSSDLGVVLSHMYPADQSSWHLFGRRLATMGLAALAFDFRGYGDSQDEKNPALIDRDVEAAVDYLLTQGVALVVLIGASMGGTASLIVADRRVEVVGVATLSAPLEFNGLDARDAVDGLTTAALFIAAEGDGRAERFARGFADAATAPAVAFVVPGSDHGTELLEGDQSREVGILLVEFVSNLSRSGAR